MKKPRYSDSQIMTILKQAQAGTPVSQLCHEHGMSSASFYKWRAKYGGMDTSMIARLKELEAENARLKKMYADVQLQNDVIKEAMKKKVVRPARRKDMAKRAVSEGRLSIRAARVAFSISESCYRYDPKLSDENAEIADWLLRLTDTHRTGAWA